MNMKPKLPSAQCLVLSAHPFYVDVELFTEEFHCQAQLLRHMLRVADEKTPILYASN